MKKLINKIRAKFYTTICDYYQACYETALNEGNEKEAGICAAKYDKFAAKI